METGSIEFGILLGLTSVFLAVLIGFLLGRQVGKQERANTLEAILAMLQSTEALNREVDSHNTKLKDVGRTVGDLDVGGEFEQVQQLLMNEI